MKIQTSKATHPRNLTDRKDKDNLFLHSTKETYSLPISKYLEDNAITQILAVFHLHVGTLWHINTRILLYAEMHMLLNAILIPAFPI